MGEGFIQIKGGIFVCVPDSPSALTTWVLLEQEDWFEKEIAFVRRLIEPGMKAIDIGANYGVYTLTMAKASAPNGEVWAFEPASTTSAMLRRSVEQNDLTNVCVVQAAMSSREGSASLQIGSQAEHNRLSTADGVPHETVIVTTLDKQGQELKWGRIDFVKIDAEGEEMNILAGGECFFADQSPLVMFETSPERDKSLRTAFIARGYELYRLVGPDRFLVPLAIDEELDHYELNLFACKRDRAIELAQRGLLAFPPFSEGGYAAGPGDRDRYQDAIDAYAFWRDLSQAPSYRYGALVTSVELLRMTAEEKPTLGRLSSLARASFELGQRHVAVQTAQRLLTELERHRSLPNELMLPPTSRYEAIAPGDAGADWLFASAFEAYEQWRAHSSYFLPIEQGALKIFDQLAMTRFASSPMERRRQLRRIRAGLQSGPVETPLLIAFADDNLNPSLWAEHRETQ